MFAEAPCFNSTLMMSVLLYHAATMCRAVDWSQSLHLFTSTPLSNSNSVTSVLFSIAAHLSAVPIFGCSLSTGTPSFSNVFNKLTSPTRASRVKLKVSSYSISRRIKQFHVCEILMRLWKFHLGETINHLISFEQWCKWKANCF